MKYRDEGPVGERACWIQEEQCMYCNRCSDGIPLFTSDADYGRYLMSSSAATYCQEAGQIAGGSGSGTAVPVRFGVATPW
jgi:hypothetical protein